MAVATAPGCASSNPGMNVSFGVSGNNIPRSSSPNNNGGNNASCTIQSLLQTAKKLAERLNEHETNVESIITQTQELNKHMVSMKTYKDEVDGINENNRPRPQLNNSRRQLIKGIQYENRQIKTLQRENEELKQALEEHQNAMELIMSKYREHVSTLSQYAKLDLTTFNAAVNQREIEQKNAKIMEMVSVMQQVVRLDESSAYAAEKKIAELEYQNKTLRELLKVSQDFKSRILLASAAEPHTAASPVNSGGGPDTAGIVQGDDPNSNNSSRSTDENNSEGEDADVSSPNADLMFEYPSRTVKKRPSLGLNNSGSNSNAGLFATQFAPESSQNSSLSFSPSDSFSTGSHSWVEEGERTRPDTTQSSSVDSGDQGNPKSEHTGQVTMNGFGQSTNGDANAGQPLTNGPVVEFEFKRNANSNNNNNNSFEGASMNNKATSSDSGLNITNHRSQQQHHLESSGGISKSRFGSETDIISDTDSDSSSNASTVTLTPCTSDREDEDDTGHHWTSSELDLEESLAISSTLSSVADEVEQFSKAASNCLLTNGCFDPDFHNANTTTSSNINSSNNNNNSAPIPSVINTPSNPSSSTPQITASDCDAAPLPNGVA